MNSAKCTLSWFLAISLFASSVNAQHTSSSAESAVVPRLVNFSGKAVGAQGKAITGIAGATFAIYKDQYEGSPLWLEPQNIQADAKGNYAAQLGATKPDGLPLDLFTAGEARWLGVTINGGTEQPRVLLLSVPYALKAEDAETLGGKPASAFLLAPAASSPATRSATTNSAPPALPLSGTGTTNHIAKWKSSTSLENSGIFETGSGLVGIGTTTPAATLDLKGTGDVRDTLTLFPSGTHPSPSVSGTAFNVSSNGTVSFVSGQTFPGTGSVSSVGLSAPSLDFTVTGSPVTTNGTLALNWNVAPTSLNTPNAIVKRDSSGNIVASVISAAVVNATNSTLNGTLTVGAGANISNPSQSRQKRQQFLPITFELPSITVLF